MPDQRPVKYIAVIEQGHISLFHPEIKGNEHRVVPGVKNIVKPLHQSGFPFFKPGQDRGGLRPSFFYIFTPV